MYKINKGAYFLQQIEVHESWKCKCTSELFNFNLFTLSDYRIVAEKFSCKSKTIGALILCLYNIIFL